MRNRLLLAVAAATFALGQPNVAYAKSCEEICGEKAAQNCEDIDSLKCSFYIMGCLSGCSLGKIVIILGDEGR